MKTQKPASLSSSLLARQGEARPVPPAEGQPEEGSQPPPSPEMQAQHDELAARLTSEESMEEEPAPEQGEEGTSQLESPEVIPAAQEVRERVTLSNWAQRPSREAGAPESISAEERSEPDSTEGGTLRARGFMFVIIAAVLGSLIGLWLGKDEGPATPSVPAGSATLQPGAEVVPSATSRNIVVAPLGPAASRPTASSAPPRQTATPKPSTQARSAAAAPLASDAATALTGAYAVQLASARSEEISAREWTRLAREHATLLGGIAHEIARAEIAGRGTYYRLRVGGFDAADEARNLCTALKAEGQDCLVVRR